MGCALSTSSVRTRFSGKEVSSEDTPNAASDLERLCKETLVGEIVQRGTASYAAAVASARSANNCAPTRPALVLVPTSAEDVSVAMRCAAEGDRRGVWRLRWRALRTVRRGWGNHAAHEGLGLGNVRPRRAHAHHRRRGHLRPGHGGQRTAWSRHALRHGSNRWRGRCARRRRWQAHTQLWACVRQCRGGRDCAG